MISILLHLLWDGRKTAQIGQTEQKQGTPCFWLPEGVHRYVERRSLFKTQGNKKQKEFEKFGFLP